MEFEWDEAKAAANVANHGVSFEEAKTVFDDRLYVDFYDPKHSPMSIAILLLDSRTKGAY